MVKISATAFALLAQFALRPTSAYGLTLAMRVNLHYLWPRAESRIYAEVGRLEARGLLRGARESVGRRPRRIMRVTAAGHAAIAAWMRQPAAQGIPIESEALMRVFFAPLGSVADFHRTLTQLRSEALELMDVAVRIGEAYLAGAGTEPSHAPVRALMHRLLARHAMLVEEWASDCLDTTASWRDFKPAGKRRQAMTRFAATNAELKSRGRASTG